MLTTSLSATFSRFSAILQIETSNMVRRLNTQPCYVLGVGMTKFIKPRGKVDYTELGFEAGVKAMLDAQINYDDVDQGGK
jgi:sterol carrier protein 2